MRPAVPPAAASAMTQALAALAPWQQYICRACGLIYDEAQGDADSGLAAGTRFADIPVDWSCPLCGVTKADFEPYAAPRLDALHSAVREAAHAVPAARGRAGVVIVGAGRAGWQLAEALRGHDAALPITLVTACSGDLYDKPLLSVALARGLTAQGLVKETGARAAQRLGIRLLVHTQAVHICADIRQLRTTRGALRYDQLVLAHGAQAALPPALPAALCWRINHLDAWTRLQAALAGSPRDVLIVGAGLVGSELANDLALAGHRVTLLETAAEPLARWQAQGAGTGLLQAWKDLAIQFAGGVQVSQVERVGAQYRVTTACGRRFAADQVIAATGLQTPSRLARSAGLHWRGGIAVDAETLRTSDPCIHALGDCISIEGASSRFIEPIARQARTIAAALAGGSAVPYRAAAAVVRVKTTSHPLTLH